ncbi:ATP-binding protein [Bradyrhizobium sp.]|uniref:hybrid sensor histidine kinase/response regulator n=1 Tax=Bradyrhizobium sp. TaxID=376 RepID=UPI000A8C8B3D|nr:ATP-binding protein [Bradyrhizobium sp.]
MTTFATGLQSGNAPSDPASSDLSAWSLKDFIETTPSCMAMFDTQMRYLAVSPRFLIDNEIEGETQQSIVGRSVFDFRSATDKARETNHRVLSGETITKSDFCFRRSDGTVTWMRWHMQPWRQPDRSVGGAVLAMEIVTAPNESAERLAASESLLRLSQEAGHIGSYDWDIGGGPNLWSDEQCRLHGIEPSGARSISIDEWRNLMHPDDLPVIEQRLADIIETGGSGELEHRIRGPNGVRWIYSRGQIVREPGKPTRLIGINMDITERRKLEDDLRELTRTLEQRVEQEVAAREAAQIKLAHAQKIRSIGEFTGGVAHDFNNLLTVITGSIDTLAEGVADRPQLAAIVQMIGSAADRGAKLTSNLLAFARKQPLRPRSTDVEALIATTSDLLTSVLGRQIEINYIKRGYVGTVFVDPDQLSSALVNLGINARDAMPNGGRLTIDADTVAIDQDEAALRDLSAGGYVAISITDTGTGIDKAIQSKIYEPFFSTKGIGEGTGLGLSMVYGFVKQSGGHIDFETVEGKGTTFRLYLPTSEHPPSLASDNLRKRLPRGHETILCVEDDAIVRDFVTQQLQALGYQTIAVSNATEALEEVRSGPPIDLVFTDIVMPGSMDGWKLAELILQMRPGTRVIYTTGYSDVSSERLGSDAGILLLEKPYRLSRLAEVVRHAIDSPAPIPGDQ